MNAYNRAWVEANRDRHRANALTWLARNRERVAKQKRLRDYGLSEADFEKMLTAQENACAICKREFTCADKNSTPHVDHDHRSGEARGLLCNRCNTCLGHFGDNIEGVGRVVSYLTGSCLIEESENV
jgi:hypothetical protein